MWKPGSDLTECIEFELIFGNEGKILEKLLHAP